MEKTRKVKKKVDVTEVYALCDKCSNEISPAQRELNRCTMVLKGAGVDESKLHYVSGEWMFDICHECMMDILEEFGDTEII